jgi:hypothetical protein
MKQIFITILVALACLVASSKVSAQAAMQATIPFSFTVEERLLPAGEYLLQYVTPSVIELMNSKGHVRLFVRMAPSDYVGRNPHRLIFKQYGDKYFLNEMRGGLGEYALSIRPSKLERKIQNEQAALANEQSADIALK